MERWRLILDRKRPAKINMAVDEAILTACANEISPPTLRIYDWTNPAISLGRLQKITPNSIDIEYCKMAGIDIVRRPTGGRGVLHGHDVTFSIVLPEENLPKEFRGVRNSHRWLMAGIVGGLRKLGIDAGIGENSPVHDNPGSQSDCFSKIAECDIHVGLQKIVGAAQARRDGIILEQCSIPHAQPSVDIRRIFAHPATNAFILAHHVRRDIEQAIVQGMRQSLELDICAGSLSDWECNFAADLAESKYDDAD